MASALIREVLSLPAAERMELIEQVWDSLLSDPTAVPVTDAQKLELDRRVQAHREDPSAGSSWEDVKVRFCGNDD